LYRRSPLGPRGGARSARCGHRDARTRGHRTIAVDDLYLAPGDTPHRETVLQQGELIVRVVIPASPFAAGSRYVKVRERASYEFAPVSVAACLELDGVDRTVCSARIVIGGVAYKPWRARAAEDVLVNLPLTDERITTAAAAAIHIFAGLRLDPFFLDVPREVETRATRRIAFQAQGTNTLDGLNILSIVVEFDVATVLGRVPGTMFAVAAEAVTSGAFPVRLERLGRAEVKNILLSDNGVDSINREHDVRDLYNQEDPFQLTTDHLGTYRARLNANLAFFDSLDGKIDWLLKSDGAHPLTELLLADFLVVDVAKPFAEDSYLEIERALLQGQAYATCGGRSLNEDVIDKLYTLIVTAGNGPRVSDGVDQATVRASQSFPYLAPPNLDPPDRDPGSRAGSARCGRGGAGASRETTQAHSRCP
jgi:Domain of unknown function (DUF4331)/CO dehydrogenase flavoprotein C-terminal domain